MKHCGLVIRVSTEEQAQNKEGSLTNQLQRLRAHIEYKTTACGEDWQEVDRYILRGVSGKDSMRSKEFARLFQDIEAGRVNTVICTALDRVSRSVKDFLFFFEFLTDHDVEFISLRQNLDTTSPQGKFFITVLMALAEFEREQTSERNKDATLARAERGLWNGGQLLGFNLDPDNRGSLVPNEREKAVVTFAFDTYLECGSILETVKRLNERGYRTKEYHSRRDKFHPASEFGHGSVQLLLMNCAYIGKKEINKKNKAKDQEALPESQRYRIVDAVWESLVQEEKFLKVQELLKANNQTKHNGAKRTRHTYVLNGKLLWCGECGERMEGRCGTGRKETKYFYYLCVNKECRFKVPAGEIEGVIRERIQQIASDPDILKRIVSETNERLQTELPKLTEQRSALEKELADVTTTAEGLVEQWETLATDDGAVFLKERLDELGKRRSQLEAGIEEVALRAEDMGRDAVNQEVVIEALSNFTEVFECIPPYQQKELMRLVLHKAVVSYNHMELALYGKPPELSHMTQGAARSQTSDWLPVRNPSRNALSLFGSFERVELC